MPKPGWTDLIAVMLLVVVFSGGGGSGLPVSEPGLHVLIIEETEARSELGPGQFAIINSVPMSRFLDESCVEDGWRVWDKDTDVTREADFWQEAMKVNRSSVPWLIVWNGNRGASGSLPATVEATKTVIEKYK
tara:strand:+ start:59 stop:457 length:399 start_codon:yes stop_codon:yes gene_type:complete